MGAGAGSAAGDLGFKGGTAGGAGLRSGDQKQGGGEPSDTSGEEGGFCSSLSSLKQNGEVQGGGKGLEGSVNSAEWNSLFLFWGDLAVSSPESKVSDLSSHC